MNKQNEAINYNYLTFVTGNKTKAQEVQALLPGIKILDIDLPELQELDSKKIIMEKLQRALKQVSGPLIVEDTGLYLDCLGGQLPGPLVKWFLKTIRPAGLAGIAQRHDNYGAQATSIIGYASSADDIRFFQGSMRGTIVTEQQNSTGFGWDTIFIPEGHTTTLANMDLAQKNSISMRAQAVNKLKEYLAHSAKAHPEATRNLSV